MAINKTKNSLYVDSLVSFILDTKPYHVKLTEIVEEYRFFDDVKVSIKERFSSKTKIDSTWSYNYFSSANPLFRTMPANRMVSPMFSTETLEVGKDENIDLASVPFAYSKKSLDGPGVNEVYVRRNNLTESLIESVDYFQSHGSFQFQVKQTTNANNELDPLWAITPDDDVITEARRVTRINGLDRSNPASSISKITSFLDEIQEAVDEIGGHEDVQRELDTLYAIMDGDDLPQSYEALLAWLAIPNDDNVIVPLDSPHDRQYFEQQFSNYSSPLFFGMFTDLGVRESGRIEYSDTKSKCLQVSDIRVKQGKDIEEWTLSTIGSSTLYRIVGSASGFIGTINAGETFDNGTLSFNSTFISTPTNGDSVFLTPTRKLVIGPDAPLETWNVIKVNPIAHNRPVLTSSRYGYIQDLNGIIGNVSILDPTLPSGDIILTSRGDGYFDLESAVDNTYTGLIKVGVPYNDGKLGFTIISGPNEFPLGDRFYISIQNLPAHVEDLDLGYGYDLDPYDDDDITNYPNGNKVGFFYDGRFTDYDLSNLNLQILENAVDGRKWRLRALPDYTREIRNVPGVPNISQNLPIYYANRFALEYSDNDFSNKVVISTIAIGGSFSSAEHGISFTIPDASRPFVAVSADDAGTRIEGGDVFSFTVKNPYPTLVESPVGLLTSNMSRLIPHSDSFFKAPAAKWTVSFTDSNSYTVFGTDGLTDYGPVSCTLGTPGIISREGHSFKGLGIHFTIVPASGMIAGDKFTFETYAQKPTYLVHGSVSGFTPPATVGKYYWNGKIGFKIRAPYSTTYINGREAKVNFTYELREDCPSIIYTFIKSGSGYQITRSDTGESGFSSETVKYQDQYLSVDLTGVTEQQFLLSIDAHDYPLWNTADVIVLHPKVTARLPSLGEHVVIEKTEEGKLSLNLVPGVSNISGLNPITIDQRFIDTNTHGLPLAQTSPETNLFKGWIPLVTSKFDSQTSIAEFSDHATSFSFTSAANGENIGSLKGETFEWDRNFFSKYLPLNAEANLVIQNTGWNDRVNTRITESVKFLLGGGALFEDWMFQDEMHVSIIDSGKFNIVSKYNDDISAIIEDGPFAGFSPGYDNVPFDTEGYDTGLPPDVYSLLGRYDLTNEQKDAIFAQWNFYLQSNAEPTTEAQWAYMRAALAGDPNPGLITSDIGYPVVGMGMDIVDRPDNSVGASIIETMIIRALDQANLLDSNNYDIGLLDKVDKNTVIMYSSLPGIQAVPPGATYDSYDTTLFAEEPAETFEISFNASKEILAAFSPKFSIWLPGQSSPVQVIAVDRLSPGVFSFKLAKASSAKIIVTT
jgi:hypothetical protein